MEALWEYLSRNIKIAWKSVFFNFKQYVCFFAAIFIVQMFYGIMAISTSNNDVVEQQHIEEEYYYGDFKYDLALYNLNEYQHNIVVNYNNEKVYYAARQSKYLTNEEEGEPIVHTYKSDAGNEYNRYDVYVDFTDFSPEEAATAYEEFMTKYVDGDKKNDPILPAFGNLTPPVVSELFMLEIKSTTQSKFLEIPTLTLSIILFAFCAVWFIFRVVKPKEAERTFGKVFRWVVTAASLVYMFVNCWQSDQQGFFIITLALFAVSVFLMISLYKIRINQYKFTYGIYMTCGADFTMLFGTAFWELFLISLVTFIPAMISSTLTVFFIYKASGFAFTFFLPAKWLLVGLFSLLVVMVSVISPMKIMSLQSPMSLIRTDDNSNYVSSPRRSFNLLGKKFPKQYELYSIWRFRKYNIQLLTSAIAFCALFIVGLYMGKVYDTSIEYSKPQYVVSLSETGKCYNPGAKGDASGVKTYTQGETDLPAVSASDLGLDRIPEITKIEQYGESRGNSTTDNEGNVTVIENFSSPMTKAEYISSHTLIPSNRAVFLTNFLNSTEKEGYKAVNEVIYKATDWEQIKFFDDSGYHYDGNLQDVLKTDKNYCIVGDSISNMKKFDLQPGDTIMIATKVSQYKNVDSNVSGRSLLKQQLQYFKFEYTEFTVAAVIHDIPCDDLPVYVLGDQYKKVTGINPNAVTLNIYTDPDISNERTIEIMDEIKEYGFESVGPVTVLSTRRAALQSIDADKHTSTLYIVISILILTISPLIWFFNQILYYKKREKEFNIIQSMGAKKSDIRKIYLLGGISMAIMSLVVSILLSYIASYVVYYFVNVILPSINKETIRFTFYLPWYALVISAVVSVACGFFSTYVPYRSYFKNRFSLENGGSGLKDDE
ncbi:MAG: ABC transporter permease [Clostridia bacterium]|nr:ABC transporter permease [Clostridia bacterium]